MENKAYNSRSSQAKEENGIQMDQIHVEVQEEHEENSPHIQKGFEDVDKEDDEQSEEYQMSQL